MNRFIRSLCLVLATLFIWAPGSNAQSSTSPQALRLLKSMRTSVTILQNRSGQKDKDIAAKLQEVVTRIQELQRLVDINPDETPPKIYLDSLSADDALLMAIAQKRLMKKQLMEQLGEVESDLSSKITFARAARGGTFGLVEAVVHTVRDKDEVGGYEVWYVPKGLAGTSGYERPFDRLSSPSLMRLAPGNYFIWSVKDGVRGERRPLSLGNDGASKREVDLPVK